jgi:hypothetical protein
MMIMATIKKRVRKWQAQVRRNGRAAVSKSFINKDDAQIWAKQTEISLERIDLGRVQGQLQWVRFGGLLKRHLDDITPNKHRAAVEGTVVEAILRRPICNHTLNGLMSSHLAAYCDLRLRDVKPTTVARELSCMRHCFEVVRKEWDMPLLGNPLNSIGETNGFTKRDLRVLDSEMRRLLAASIIQP